MIYINYFITATPSSTLFVKGLTDETSKQDLASVFAGASDIRIMTDRETGACKGLVLH